MTFFMRMSPFVRLDTTFVLAEPRTRSGAMSMAWGSELPNLPLEDALQLVHLYAERRSPKYERAAMRWLERYLVESSPRLQHFAEITAGLAKLGVG
jgi:hypothetical protein